jgi:hypothetical protein
MYKQTIQAGCRASVCVKRNQVKVYNPTSNGGEIFLKDGQEFEIELYNPTQKTVAAKIILNGVAQQHSIVLKPGQRAYIERYPDEPKKFKFDTYVVDGSAETQQAIASNGSLRVEFYDEYVAPQLNFTYTSGTNWLNQQNVNNVRDLSRGLDDYRSKGVVGSLGTQSMRSSFGGASAGGSSLSESASFFAHDAAATTDWMEQVSELRRDNVETGRIEKGARSNQNFSTYYGSFNSYYTYVTEFKLLPVSQKPLEVKDLAEYCTECGAKNKKNWKFCPSCGNKF